MMGCRTFPSRNGWGSPAVGHMPFPGHRTVATIWAQQAAARKREREHRKSMDWGFEPDSLKAGE